MLEQYNAFYNSCLKGLRETDKKGVPVEDTATAEFVGLDELATVATTQHSTLFAKMSGRRVGDSSKIVGHLG